MKNCKINFVIFFMAIGSMLFGLCFPSLSQEPATEPTQERVVEIIEQSRDGFTVKYNGKIAKNLTLFEVMGVVSWIYVPENRPELDWFKVNNEN